MPTPTSTETATLTQTGTLRLLYLPVILNENLGSRQLFRLSGSGNENPK
jgi:hypothetical protein